MKKNNNKGFVLTETLFVSVVVITVLLALYFQFNKMNNSSNTDFARNRTNDVMILENIGKYLLETDIFNTQFEYLDITNCANSNLTSRSVCNYLVSVGEIDKLIVTKNGMEKLKKDVQRLGYTNEFKDYISSLKNTYSPDGYRIVAYFANGTSANLVVRG